MTSLELDGTQPMAEERQTLIDASVVEVIDGQTIMKFTKLMKEPGEIEIGAGDNIFLWADGYSTTLGLHKKFGSVDINLSSGLVEARYAPNMTAWAAHGIMAFIAWGALVPFAVQFSMFRGLLPKRKKSLWYKLHRDLNGMAFTLTVALFAVAVAYTAKEGRKHFEFMHQWVGLFMIELSCLQVLGGVIRPHLPPPGSGDKKTKFRQVWEIAHRVMGTLMLALGFWLMYSGIQWYSFKYNVDLSAWLIAYWVWIGLMAALFFVGFGYSTLRIQNATKATTVDEKSQPDSAQNTLRSSSSENGDEDQTWTIFPSSVWQVETVLQDIQNTSEATTVDEKPQPLTARNMLHSRQVKMVHKDNLNATKATTVVERPQHHTDQNMLQSSARDNGDENDEEEQAWTIFPSSFMWKLCN